MSLALITHWLRFTALALIQFSWHHVMNKGSLSLELLVVLKLSISHLIVDLFMKHSERNF
jgi:hypothetical protein